MPPVQGDDGKKDTSMPIHQVVSKSSIVTRDGKSYFLRIAEKSDEVAERGN